MSRVSEDNESPAGASTAPVHGARGARIAVAAIALLTAIALAVLSLFGYDTLKSHLDPLSVDRDANVTRAEFDAIVLRLRVLAVSLVVLAAVLVAAGRSLDSVAGEVARSWWSTLRTTPALLRGWLVREEALFLGTLGLVLIAAMAVRVAFLDVPLRYDEATTYNNFVSKPLHVALANYSTPNNHLLHTFLAKLSTGILGNEPWTVRLPALLAGVALVPATFALARVLYGRAASLLAAALVATASTFVEYSTNARAYTIAALLAVVVLIAAARALERDSAGAWAVVAVAGALGLYAVPVMLYPLGGVLVWLLASGLVAGRPLPPLAARIAATGLAATVLTLVLYAPVYAASGIRSVTSNEFVEPQSWSAFVELLPEHFRDTADTWTRDLPLAVALVLGASLAASLVLTPRISRFPLPPLLAVAVWTAPVLLLQRVVPFTRVWLLVLPLAIVTVAGLFGWALERGRSGGRAAPALAVLVAVGGSLLVLSADSVRESRETGALLDAPEIASYLAGRVGPDDRILATGSDTILEYYLEREGVDAGALLYGAEPRPQTYVVVNVLGGQTVDDLVRQLDASADTGAPRLLRRYPSGLVYLVERPI